MMYRCSKCKRLYERDSTKAWIKSYCGKTDQYARLMRADLKLSGVKLKWQGLTEDEINEVLGGDIRDEPSGLLEFARAIEAKLKEKNT